ncbi:MAG: TetR/AcrR family transcriptional regulator [Firmicutes bacterium]|nr:TetR/AcrR family transcriptional regulator [Bacillota bacterium]
MARHFTDPEKDNIKQEIQTAGLKLFEKYSVDRVTISDIAKEVGISAGSFYSFYKSKGDLLLDVYGIERGKAQKELAEQCLAKNGDIENMLRNYFKLSTEAFGSRPILNTIYDSESFKLISDRAVRDALLLYNEKINEEITNMVQTWMDKYGKFSIEARIITELIRSTNFLKFHKYAIGAEIFDDVHNTMIEAIIHYIKNSQMTRYQTPEQAPGPCRLTATLPPQGAGYDTSTVGIKQ